MSYTSGLDITQLRGLVRAAASASVSGVGLEIGKPIPNGCVGNFPSGGWRFELWRFEEDAPMESPDLNLEQGEEMGPCEGLL